MKKYLDLASQEAIELVIQEKKQEESREKMYGIKINEKNLGTMTIYDVVQKMKINENYVIGYDKELSEKEIPHYHIHFLDTRSFVALQSHKKRALKDLQNDDKIYQAKDKTESDVNCWYGYAVKEKIIHISEKLDRDAIIQQAMKQASIKKDKIKYQEKKTKQRENKKTTEEELYKYLESEITVRQNQRFLFYSLLGMVVKYFLEKEDKLVMMYRAEQVALKFLLKTGRLHPEKYVELSSKFRDFEINI